MTRPLDAPEIAALDRILSPHDFDNLPLQEWPQQWHPTDHFPTPQTPTDGASPELVHQLSFRNHAPEYRLGEPNLPVAPYRDLIVDTIANNQSTVISSETGSGKSSQIGLYLLEAGFPRVFITQPRILAARELMQRARYNLGPDRAHLAGYLTGNADDSDCPEGARLIYVTDHRLFNIANRGQLRSDDTVVHDEAHERTPATVVFMGRMREILAENPDMREVVSSATINTDRFAEYLGEANGRAAPVLILPGRTFPIELRETSENVAEAMRRYMDQGKNVLAFEPGIARLKATATKAQSRRSNDNVYLLYGDQAPADQALALNPADGNHVVSSRIGETSITPQNKQVIIDSGLSNLGGYRAGVRELHTVHSSQATMGQRGGRGGRLEPGIHEIATPDDAPPPPAFKDRPLFDPPSIETTSVASLAAELLAYGRRLEDLPLIETPTDENLRHDYTLLSRLGATALGDNGELVLTDVGRAMTDLPLDAPLARMLIEARRPTDDPEVDQEALRLQVAAAVAIQQVNGILNAAQGSERRYVRRKSHQEVLSSEQSSDVLFALDVFTVMRDEQQRLQTSGVADWETRFDKILADNDVLPNRYYKALRTFEELCRRENLSPGELAKPATANRDHIIACQIVGAEELFVQRSKQVHLDIRGERRTLGRRTTIASHLADLVIGTAFDYRGLNKRGSYGHRFIAGGSTVTVQELLEHVPHRITRQSLGYGVSRKGQLVDRVAMYFDGNQQFVELEDALPPTKESRVKIITAMMTGRAPSARDPQQTVPFSPGTENASAAVRVWKEALALQEKTGVNLKVTEGMAKLIRRIVNDSVEQVPLDVTDPALLDALIPERVYIQGLVRPTRKRQIDVIRQNAPDAIKIQIDDETSELLPVDYRNRVGYVTIPRALRSFVTRESFANVTANYVVKIRIGNSKYLPLESVLRLLDEQRVADEAKKELKEERQQARLAAQVARGDGPTRHERRVREFQELETESSIRTQLNRESRMRESKIAEFLIVKRPDKGAPKASRKQRVQKLIERAAARAQNQARA